jgi:valyl-tRNA synthetase
MPPAYARCKARAIQHLTSEIAKVEAELAKVNAKLANPTFAEKVPASVLEGHLRRQTRWQEKLTTLRASLISLG